VTWSHPQRDVAFGMGIGLAVTLASLGVAVLLQPFGAMPGAMSSRLEVLALGALAPSLALAFSIARLAAHRFHTPQDLDGSGLTSGTERASLLQALLQNTLEQVALALPVYAAWALLAPTHLIAVLPVAALLFLFGRTLFFWGYARGAAGRALGFALTFYPTVVLLAGAIALGVRYWVAHAAAA
jgi:hypothetical protein